MHLDSQSLTRLRDQLEEHLRRAQRILARVEK